MSPVTLPSNGVVIDADELGEPSPASESLRFMSAAELKLATPPEVPWIWHGYLFEGGLTMLAGKPKAGKSRLSLDLATAFVDGAHSFLAKSIKPGPVVYVSEEGAATLAHKLPSSDLVRVLTRENAWPKPDWPTLVTAAATEAQTAGARLLVIDTLPYWAGMPAEREKDSGAALAVMDACVEAARGGIAVLLPSHSRKGGGEDGEGIRGSSAFAGSVDIIVELERVPDAPRQRALLALSRFPQTPGTLVAELGSEDQEWRVISEDVDRGDTRAIAARQRSEADRQAILSALDAGGARTRAELEELTGSPSRQWYPQVEALLKDGQVTKSGKGKKGDPYRYEKVRTNSAQNAAQSVRTNGAAKIHLSAHPRSGAERNFRQQQVPNGAQCAETCAETGRTNDELQALIDAEDELLGDRA